MGPRMCSARTALPTEGSHANRGAPALLTGEGADTGGRPCEEDNTAGRGPKLHQQEHKDDALVNLSLFFLSVAWTHSPPSPPRAGSGTALLQLHEAGSGTSWMVRFKRATVAGSRARDALRELPLPPCGCELIPPLPLPRTVVTFLGRSLPLTYACMHAWLRERA